VSLEGTVPPRSEETTPSGTICIKVDLRLYAVEALEAAVYRFADRGFFLDDVDWDNKCARVAVYLSMSEQPTEELQVLFRQELTDQSLRHRIRAETEAVRNLILAHAFADSALAGD